MAKQIERGHLMANSIRSNSVAARDVAFQIHSQTKPPTDGRTGPAVVTRGEGIRIYDSAEKTYIDAMAGLWCASARFFKQPPREPLPPSNT